LIDSLAKEPAIRPRVTAAVFVGQRRWNLRLDNGVEVRLPEEGADAALAHLAKLDREQQILAREIDAIDLRFPDKLIVRLPANSPLSPNKPPVEGRDT
jgi:cell division protein FtsQ